jgi:hypothetical protein
MLKETDRLLWVIGIFAKMPLCQQKGYAGGLEAKS